MSYTVLGGANFLRGCTIYHPKDVYGVWEQKMDGSAGGTLFSVACRCALLLLFIIRSKLYALRNNSLGDAAGMHHVRISNETYAFSLMLQSSKKICKNSAFSCSSLSYM